MTVMVWYDNAMKRGSRLLKPLLFGGLLLCTFFLGGGVSHAQGGGGVGGGGSGTGGGGGAQTSYGHGWYVYDVGSDGPKWDFRNGTQWESVQSTCRGYSSKVAVYIIRDVNHEATGYDYIPGKWGTLNLITSPSPWISPATAKEEYEKLRSDIRAGFRWGVDVGWFCYGIIPPSNKSYLDGLKISSTGATSSAFSTLSVSVFSSGSDVSNPFYFTDASGGGNSIDMGTATSTTRMVSISGVPPGWQLLGHSICAKGSSCTDAWLASNIVDRGKTSFRHTFRSGVTYHMRWMFQQITATCTIDTFPAQMVVGGANQFTVSMGISHWGAPFVVGNPALTVQVRDPIGVVTTSTPTYTVSGSDPATITSAPVSFNSNLAGTYQMQWSLAGNGLYMLCPGGNNGSWSNPRIGNAGYRPYFSIVGGDILSGDSIRSWNTDGGAYIGGGTQLAALATNNIQNFVSGTGLPGGAAAQGGDGLGFANTGASGTTYGGGYAVSPFVPEVPPQTNLLSQPAVDLGSLAADGVYYARSSVRLYGQLATGRQVTIYATAGNSVYISGDITYGAYGANTTDIPRLTVIAENGNISIASTVGQVRGIFIAQGSGLSGNFHTCASDIDTPITSAEVNAYGLCNSRLTVYGAVAANKLVLGRTYGTFLTNSTGVPVSNAEEFYYSPELWLAPDGTGSASGAPNRYDSFVSMPPVL